MDKECRLLKTELASKYMSGRVLDVGAGGGGWIPYLDQVQSIVALEPNALLKETIEQVAKDSLKNPRRVTVFTGFVNDLPVTDLFGTF